MSIYAAQMFGASRYDVAIERVKSFCAGKRVLCAFSGGKDSQVCYHLLQDAGIDFHAEYSITRFEPPELLRFVRQHYPDVTFRRAYKMSLIDEITLRGLPNRWARWCCQAKHIKTDGYDITVLGVRWQESEARRETWRMMGYKQDHTAYICPIIDWETWDVWEYLGDRAHCPLYDRGMPRIGCVCCPLVPGQMKRDVAWWPRTAEVLRRGGCAFVARMRARNWITAKGKRCSDWCDAPNPEAEYWRRWITTGQTAKPDMPPIPADECLFAGTGFGGTDGAEADK